MLSGVSASQGAAWRRGAWQPFHPYAVVLPGKQQAASFLSGAGYAAVLHSGPAPLSVPAVQYKAFGSLLLEGLII